MHLLRHSEELILQLIEFLERHSPTLAHANVRRYTVFSVDWACFMQMADLAKLATVQIMDIFQWMDVPSFPAVEGQPWPNQFRF
jgi:hypothetical protein